MAGRKMGSLFCALVFLCLLTNAFAQEPPPVPPRLSVADLAWMAGRWAGEKDGAWVEEIWTAPEAGSMIGMSRIVKKSQPVFYEFGAIEQGPNGPILRLAHFEPGMKAWDEKGVPMTWEVVSWQKQEVVFRRTDAGQETLTYRRETPDTLLVVLEKRVEGKTVRSGFLYKRAG